MTKACKDPSTAGATLAAALLAGGEESAAAVKAAFADCPTSGESLIQALADYVNPRGNADFERVLKCVLQLVASLL